MPADHTKLEHATKRHARTRRGCLTCRIRKKKCDSSRPSCTKCERLHVQCLGYASDRPDWLKGDCAKGYTQAIKCFLSEYPAAKAYDDPVPYLVLKSTPEVERMLAADPGHYNPVYFDPDTASLKKWLPSVPPPQPPSRDPGFPVPPNAPSVSTNVPAPAGQVSSPFMPPTPSPQTPYSYPVSQYPVYSVDHAQDGLWPYTPPLADPYLQPTPFAATQPMYGLHTSGITAPSFYDPQDGHAIHYVPGPMFMARQDAYTGAACKTGYDATWASLSGLLY